MRRLTRSSLIAAVLLMTVGLGAALAAPVNNPQAEFYTLECDDGNTYDIVVTPGQPGHILGSTSKLIPHEFAFSLVVDGETVFSETESRGQKKGLQDRLISCSLQIELTPEEIADLEAELGIDLSDSDVHIQVDVRVMKTPAGRR